MGYFRRIAQFDPSVLRDGLRVAAIDAAIGKLEGTYLIRLYAEFESGALQYWEAAHGNRPKSGDLINGLAARRAIPLDRRDNAHAVREYRNGLVHERDDVPDAVPLSVARSHLCRLFSWLPPQW